ncbi:unnamed protein product [Cylicocyclus nassatus]|uniref:C2 domain-containing protein n=1 Tax=Cylicocyclus nassatus TaxID=53992 RepID=A0AA36M407_CYLNA|nr:unnamed protein product [Cylicocyclus nassatus]
MTVELLRVDWREGCLTTAGCSQPRFKVLEDMLPITERISISWPISEHFVQDASRPFVSHWTKGKPEDLTLSCRVVGSDPTYGFPRVCDQTATIRVFQEGVAEASDRNRHHRNMAPTTMMPEEELGKKLIEIRAKCFNVTIAVQKHTERCPWCPDPSDVALIELRLPEDNPALSTSILSQLTRDEKLLHVCILLLASIAVLTSLGFACVLFAFLRQKRAYRCISLKPRHQPYSSTCKAAEDQNRYDMPWEQTRPLTHKLSSSSKSEATTTSPLDSVSSLHGSPPVRSTTLAGVRYDCVGDPQTECPQTTLFLRYSHIPPVPLVLPRIQERLDEDALSHNRRLRECLVDGGLPLHQDIARCKCGFLTPYTRCDTLGHLAKAVTTNARLAKN